jgi:succinate-semialdehyde dehydrogenase / glutarate-semialdehyde dehydrogenase
MQKIDIRPLLNDPSLFKEDSFINGSWVQAQSKNRFAVTNPANGELIAEVVNLGTTEAELAIALISLFRIRKI